MSINFFSKKIIKHKQHDIVLLTQSTKCRVIRWLCGFKIGKWTRDFKFFLLTK